MNESYNQRIVRVANDILFGDVDIVTGCRWLAGVLRDAGLEHDPDALVIREVDSDSDDMPVGSARELWHLDALAERDARRDAYVARAREGVLEACRNLIRKASSPTAE